MEAPYGIPTWGDGKRVGTEACDDKNTTNGKGSSYNNLCKIQPLKILRNNHLLWRILNKEYTNNLWT